MEARECRKSSAGKVPPALYTLVVGVRFGRLVGMTSLLSATNRFLGNGSRVWDALHYLENREWRCRS
jgi:hypothetical protein